MSDLNASLPGAGQPSGDQSFTKIFRLRKSTQFEAVYQVRQSAGDSYLVMHGRYNELPHARIGLTVSRRVGNAVVRNRWKRCLREAFRQVRQRLPALDLVVAPRLGVKPNVADLLHSLPSLAGRVEKRLRTGVPPYPPRGKQTKRKTKGSQPAAIKPSSPHQPPRSDLLP